MGMGKGMGVGVEVRESGVWCLKIRIRPAANVAGGGGQGTQKMGEVEGRGRGVWRCLGPSAERRRLPVCRPTPSQAGPADREPPRRSSEALPKPVAGSAGALGDAARPCGARLRRTRPLAQPPGAGGPLKGRALAPPRRPPALGRCARTSAQPGPFLTGGRAGLQEAARAATRLPPGSALERTGRPVRRAPGPLPDSLVLPVPPRAPPSPPSKTHRWTRRRQSAS